MKGNFSINQLRKNKMKDQPRSNRYRIKFFNINDKTTDGSDDLNYPDNENTDIILYGKTVDGLPTFNVNSVEDYFYGYKQNLPTTPDLTDSTLTFNFRIKETTDPINNFFKRILKLTRLQDPNEGIEKPVVTFDEDVSLENIVEQQGYIEGELGEFTTSEIFDDCVISVLEYNTITPIMSWILRNSWISGISIGDSLGGENAGLISGSLTLTYDYPQFYKVSKSS